MSALLCISICGALLAVLFTADLNATDAPIHFRSQGKQVASGGWGGGDGAENGHGGWGGTLLFSPDSKRLLRRLKSTPSYPFAYVLAIIMGALKPVAVAGESMCEDGHRRHNRSREL